MKRSIVALGLAWILLVAASNTAGKAASPVVSAVDSQAKILQFENLSTEQGLSQSTVTAILQDRQGFMWFGTESGLNKYDGYQFTVYKHDSQDPQSLVSNVITAIYEDRDGSLWIGTSGGVELLDRQTGSFIHFKQEFNGPDAIRGKTVLVIDQDRSGMLWVGTEGGGLARLDLKTKQSTVYKHGSNDSKTISSDIVRSIYEDPDGILWIGTDQGLDRFDPATETLTHPNHDSALLDPLNDDPIYAIDEDDRGALWLGTDKGLFQWDRVAGRLNKYLHDSNVTDSISNDSIRCIFRDLQGVLWIGTRSGLNQFNASQKRFIRYNHNPNDPQSLISDSIRSVYEDRSHVLWIGTASGGLSKYAPASQKFSLYRNNSTRLESLSDNNIWSVYEDHSGLLWFGTFSVGLNSLDRESGKVTVYENDPADSTSLSANDIRTILEDRRGDIWIGTEHGGLNEFDPQTGKFTRYQHNADDPDSLSSDIVFSTFEDHLGRLWVGTGGGGLNLLDNATGTFTHYINDANNPYSLSDNNIRAIFEDGTGILWVGTFGGLNRFDEKTRRFTTYRNDPDNPVSLSSDLVFSVAEDSEGIIWVGTFGGGLNRFDRTTQTFTRFTEKNGLPDDTVYGILAGTDGALWLSTNKGIAKFDPRLETFRNYDISDGLQGNQFNPGAFFQSRDGEMFFGGTHGLNAFFPGHVTDNPVQPPVIITAFKKFNRSIQTDLGSNEPIQLSYRDNFISFEFAALDFNAPNKNQFAYQLDGFDPDWIEAGTRHYASYTNLPGGEYIFRVKASNSDGIWNETGVAVPVTITPPVWQTWWFNGALIMLLGAAVAGGFRIRFNSIREQTVYLETQISEQTSELRETNELLHKEVEQRKRAEAELEKRAAQELQESEERFRAMFEHSAVGIGVMGLDRRVIDANPAICRIYGRTREEMIGTNASEVTYPDDNPEAARLSNELISGQRDSYELERRYVRKSGEVFWAHVTMSSVKDLQGKPLYLVGMVIDIDEQKHAAERLHTSQARFQAIFDNVAVGVAVMTLGRRPIAFNTTTEKIIGYNFEEMRDIDPRLLAVPEDRGMDTEMFQELIEGKRESYVMERRYRHKSGRTFWARINYSLVRDLDGRPDYLIGIIEDIDEQKRAAERLAVQEADYLLMLQHRVNERTHELEEANQRLQNEIEQRTKIEKELSEKAAQDAVTADRTRLARDLHDAVTQTLFSSSLIAEVLPDLWEMDSNEAKKSTEELRQLTRGALAEMRTLLLELRPATLTQTRLGDLIKQLCEAFIGRSRLPIKLTMEGDCPLPPEVQVAVYRVAQESLNNVFKYARATLVNVNLFVSETMVHFETCDKGIGFDMSTSKPTSLGMRIMRERAEAIGADFQITSTPGSGTCVTLTWIKNPNLKLSVL